MFDPTFRRLFKLFVLTAAFFVAVSPVPVIAQDEDDEAPAELMDKPIATLAVASVERLKTDIKHIFEISGREDVFEAMLEGLAGAGDLKGMDQNKPFGAMLFLESGFPPTPQVVGFFPVERIEDLTKTLEIGPVITKKVDDTHYEIIGQRREFYVRLQGGYAFLGSNPDVVDNDFPDPARQARALTAKYDIAATLNLDTIPPAMRTLFMGFVKSQANAEMQQRDDEPDGVYKIRRSQSQGMVDGLTQVMEELESLTIGLDANSTKSEGIFEIAMKAQENSKLAKEMKRISSKRSFFEPLIDEDAPLTVSVSFPIEEKDMERTHMLIDGLELELEREVTGGTSDEGLPPELTNMFQSLRDTLDDRHMNMFMQFFGEPGEFVIVGGVKMTGAQRMGTGIKDLLVRLDQDPDVEIGEISIDKDTHKNVTFHYIETKEVDDGGQRMFGDKLGLYVGAGTKTVWFAAGVDNALEQFKELIDKMQERKTDRTRKRQAPFQLVFNIRQWLGLSEEQEGVQFDAFEDGGDRLTMDLRPNNDGMRIRFRMEEGFLRLLGMSSGQRFDRRGERGEGRGRRGSD